MTYPMSENICVHIRGAVWLQYVGVIGRQQTSYCGSRRFSAGTDGEAYPLVRSDGMGLD